MKHTHLKVSGLGLALLAINAAIASPTDLADVPLANAPTASILPNIAFILDDSGSMDWEIMPASSGTNSGKNCTKWYGYNTLFYNPGTTYKAPLKADGSRYTDASFSAAKRNGYDPASGITDLSALSTPPVLQSEAALPKFTKAHVVASVTVTLLDGSTIELLNSIPSPSVGTISRDDIGAAVAEQINAKTATGFTATYDSDSNVLTISPPSSQAGLTTTPIIITQRTDGKTPTGISASAFAAVNGTDYPYYATHKTDISSTICDTNTSYSIAGQPSAISAPNATTGGAAALTNYANWYTYYRKRIYLAKAAAAEAFGALQHQESVNSTTSNKAKYRIGLFYLNNTDNDLAIADFTGTARSTWFDRLFGTTVDGSTPLRTALSRAGRMYAGKATNDPVQYSCQRNFSILTTDGFWNSGEPLKIDGSTGVGDQDGASTVERPFLDSNKQSDTLADVAYYYYNTDLRTSNCTIAGKDVCEDNVPPAGTKAVDDIATHQHMTTFSIGLGVSGKLTFQEGYKNSTFGDYYDITQGTKDWPKITDYGGDTDLAKIDDLWHAAVNGHGTYFSAKNAEAFTKGLDQALGSITASTGSGAAAATSNLEPTAGDSYIYIANYRTALWDGELSAYEIDLTTGEVAANNCTSKSTKYCWQASALLADKIQKTDEGSALTGDADSRTIYTYSGSSTNSLKNFTWSALSATEKGYFNNANLSQYSSTWSETDQAAATGEKLVKYLRGQDRNEDQARLWTTGTYNRLYRDREKVLGDIIHAQPVYVKNSFYDYLDTGYAAFKAAQASRAGSVYIAANDGMLHAFNSSTGEERWAYIPPSQLKDLWRLADNDYATHHRYYLDGPIAVSDIFDGTNWKTILVGAMGKGGRGLYALDITNPSTPKALWNFTVDDKENLGYTYGIPIITKLKNSSNWVVLIASGHNNISPGDGKGYLFVLDANTGSLTKTLKTDIGSSTTPSGLTYLNIKVNDFQTDNTALAVYGGDLYGNMWRFDPEAADGTTATLVAALGTDKPITVAPEIGEVESKTVLFFGTGRYLGEDDLVSPTDYQQYFYAVKDDGNSTAVDLTKLNQVTATKSGSGSTETITLSSATLMNWETMSGWYFALPTLGERVYLQAQLYFGTILFSSVIPTATECQPGGYSWMYALDYASGLRVNGATWNSWKFISPLVGMTVAKLPTGDIAIYGITADGGVPKGAPPALPVAAGTGGSESGMRIMWREILN